MSEGLLKQKIQKEFETAYKMQDSLLKCNNSYEVQGLLKVALLPNIERFIDEAKKEWPDNTSVKPKTAFTVDTVEDWQTLIDRYVKCMSERDKWFKKWFGE